MQSSFSSSILACVLGSHYSYEVWDKIHNYFHQLTCTKAWQLCSKLHKLNSRYRPIREFLLQIKALINALCSIGAPTSSREHLDLILEGLLEEYHVVIALIESRLENIIEEVEGLILAYELRLHKYSKKHSLQFSFC